MTPDTTNQDASARREPTPRPVVFGELLFDRFPDGARVLGGAPFNVAWHLCGMGLEPLLLTRVGADSAGREALDAMAAWGMDTSGVQVDPRRATGAVEVQLADDGPSYRIAADQAWDHIDAAGCAEALAGGRPSILYHGTLAIRSASSRAALAVCRRRVSHCFVDLNLRPPWWSAESVATSLHHASWAKMNRDELAQVTGVEDASDDLEAAVSFRRRHDLRGVIVTRGSAGAVAVAEQTATVRPPELIADGDTVGAGDAFSAVCLAGLTAGRPLSEILERAALLASEVCRVRGALIGDRGVYLSLVADWK